MLIRFVFLVLLTATIHAGSYTISTAGALVNNTPNSSNVNNKSHGKIITGSVKKRKITQRLGRDYRTDVFDRNGNVIDSYFSTKNGKRLGRTRTCWGGRCVYRD